MSSHWCRYTLLKKTLSLKAKLQTWLERCRCGRYVIVEVDWTKIPYRIRKQWFDREGRSERVTGTDTMGSGVMGTSQTTVETGNSQNETNENKKKESDNENLGS